MTSFSDAAGVFFALPLLLRFPILLRLPHLVPAPRVRGCLRCRLQGVGMEKGASETDWRRGAHGITVGDGCTSAAVSQGR